MKINISNKNYFTAMLFLLVCIAFSVWKTSHANHGIEVTFGREDDVKILRNGVILVNAAVINYAYVEKFLIGIRLPAEKLECNQGDAYKIRLSNKPEYFILSLTDRNAPLQSFQDKKAFVDHLAAIKIDALNALNFQKIEEVVNRYNSYYKSINFSDCVVQ